MFRSICALTLSSGLSLSLTAHAHAGLGDLIITDTTTEGTGSNTSYLVVHFAETSGNRYAFQYNWDTPTDAYGMIEAIAADLGDFSFTANDFGPVEGPPNYFIDNVNIGADTGDAGKFWTQWEGFFNSALDRLEWEVGLGVSNIDLADGLFIGLYNPFSFEQFPDAPGINEVLIPEPTSLALLGLGGVALLARRKH